MTKATVRSRVLWTVWMAGGGLATAVVVYASTASVGWAIVGLVASGVVLNAIGQSFVQPVKASRGTRHDQTKHA